MSQLRSGFPANRYLTSGILLLALGLPFTLSAQDAPPRQQPTAADAPVTHQELQYVRRISLGVSVGLIPLSAFGKQNIVDRTEAVGTTPRVENDTTVGARGGTVNYGFVVQATITRRTAIAIVPTYRKFGFHAYVRNLVGTDLSSTFLDERVETDSNEDIKGHLIEMPVLGRFYSKSHNESGKRWFMEAGPNFRVTSGTSTARSTVLSTGAVVKDSINLPFRKDAVGGTVGFGGQFIDDFGIRVIPEVRYTYWLNKTYDSYHGRSRTNQLEINLTFSF
ncbi:MAG: outer membrane beta-barrel protein [Acidobacteriota bacterium]